MLSPKTTQEMWKHGLCASTVELKFPHLLFPLRTNTIGGRRIWNRCVWVWLKFLTDLMSFCQDSDDEDDDKKSENNEKALLKSREVFLSRQTETLPATLIRGKCSVTLLSEVETFTSYTSREDAFFYALVFDPHQKTLLADRGNIRIGSEYQAACPAVTKEVREEELEELQWQPNNDLEEDKIDQFVIISRSVGTFARALDCSSSVKQPSLHMSAAAASRDITVLHAYQVQYTFTCRIVDRSKY